jgi:hypothetical protein
MRGFSKGLKKIEEHPHEKIKSMESRLRSSVKPIIKVLFNQHPTLFIRKRLNLFVVDTLWINIG